MCYWLRDYAQSSTFYAQAIEHNPTQANYYHQSGLSFHKQGRYAEALENFDKAILLDSDYLEVKMKLSEEHLISGRFAESITLAREILHLKATTPMANILPEELLTMRFFIMTALLCQGEQSQAVEAGKALLTFYQALPDKYERTWNYAGTETFIRNTPQLSVTQKQTLLQTLILLKQAPSQAHTGISELEQGLRADK